MIEFKDIEHLRPEMEAGFADLICKMIDVPRSRLKKITLADGSALQAGRTMCEMDFDPDLSPEEQKRMSLAMHFLSAYFGGRPPVQFQKE